MENNKNKVLLNIVGIQETDGDKNKIEVITTGEFFKKNGKRYIKYTEYDNDNPNVHTNNVLKIDGNNKITIIRLGEFESRFILEKDVRHQCHYKTTFGNLMMGVYTDKINTDLTDSGGTVSVSYQLDFNADLISRNEFYITVTKSEE